jgi:hypothetical protein
VGFTRGNNGKEDMTAEGVDRQYLREEILEEARNMNEEARNMEGDDLLSSRKLSIFLLQAIISLIG